MPTPSGLTLTDARQALSAQRFSELVGAELTHFEPERTTLSVPLRKEHHQQHGLVHGGVIAYAVDNVLAFSAGTVLGPSIVSAGFAITFLRPARGVELVATGVVVNATERHAVVRCEVVTLDQAGESTICAVAQGTAGVNRSVGSGSAGADR